MRSPEPSLGDPEVLTVVLLEPSAEGDFRFRLCGTNLIERFGREATGARVDALAGDIARPLVG